jgi:lysophospholipase L1-like esterase
LSSITDQESANQAAWSRQTIQSISNQIAPSLAQRPNLVLLMAGTNDASTAAASQEGCDPAGAATRLGALVDKILAAVPDVTILVAVILPTRIEHKITLTKQLQRLIPVEIEKRTKAGKKVKAVDFSKFRDDATMLTDGVHPSNEGYRLMGDWWYSFITQIPAGWVTDAQGADPSRPLPVPLISANGGPDENISAANFGNYPIAATSPGNVKAAADRGFSLGRVACTVGPTWEWTGKIAMGIAKSGDFKWHTGWNQLGKIVEGIGRDGRYVR